MDPVCRVCGRRSPDVAPAYLRVVGTMYAVVATQARWVNFRCHCCPDCYRRGAAINKLRVRPITVGVPVMLALILAGWGVAVLHPPAEKGILTGGANLGLFFIAGLVALPFYASWVSRSRTAAFLGPELDARLRSLTGVRRWNAFNHLVVLRKIPPREPCVDLEEDARLPRRPGRAGGV